MSLTAEARPKVPVCAPRARIFEQMHMLPTIDSVCAVQRGTDYISEKGFAVA